MCRHVIEEEFLALETVLNTKVMKPLIRKIVEFSLSWPGDEARIEFFTGDFMVLQHEYNWFCEITPKETIVGVIPPGTNENGYKHRIDVLGRCIDSDHKTIIVLRAVSSGRPKDQDR